MEKLTKIIPSILVIDDEASNALLLDRILSKLGCKVITVNSGWDGIEKCKETQFAVILLDILMPEINGYETLVRIKSSTINKETPVFFMTGMETDQELLIKAYKAGAVDFIQKPMNLNILQRKTRYFLDYFVQNEELKLQREKTEQLMKSRMSLVANITHELRTPLFAMIGMVDVLQQTKLNKKQTELIQKISMNSENLLDTVNEFLDFSKTEASNNVIEYEYFSLIKLCNDIINIMAYQYHKSHNVELLFSYDHDIPEFVRADKKKIRHVLMNLFSNSLKFTSTGYVKLNIRSIGIKNGKNIIKFMVEDTGVGIPNDKVQSIFEAYSQVDENTTGVASTGLGLSISKKLVETLGGRIRVKSTENEGSIFSFSIPIESSAESELADVKDSYTLDEILGDQKLSIMIVDDVPDNLFVLKNYLNTNKIDLTLEHEPEKGLKILQSNKRFDVVLLDLSMPGLDGFKFKKTYNETVKNNKSEQPYFIALSAFSYNEDLKVKLDAIGIYDYLMKPIKKQELYKKLVSIALNLGEQELTTISSFKEEVENKDFDFELLDSDFKEYLPTYLENKEKEVLELKAYVEQDNFSDASAVCHKILGTARSFGLFKLDREIEDVQKMVKSTEALNCKDQVMELVNSCKEHLASLKNLNS